MKFKSFYALAFSFVLVFCSTTVFAQGAKLERAKKYMKELNYQGAIEVLSKVLANGDNAEAKINLAECYRKVNDCENAEFVYGQVVRLPEAQPIHFLHYGEMLQRNGKCDLAKEWYQKFSEAVPEDIRGQYVNKSCDYEEELKSKGDGIWEIKRMNFNSNFDDFGAAFFEGGIIFASERNKGAAVKRSHSWTGLPFLDLYFVPIKGNGNTAEGGRPTLFNSDVNSKYHDATVAFSNGFDQIFFTRNNYSKGKVGVDDEGIMRLKIYTAKKSGKGYSKEEGLPFNSDEYSCTHPTVSADGTKLYFSSDMPGGFGGMDIYVSTLEGAQWGLPTNLGPGVNTEGNEIFPHVTKQDRLYFSSDGHLGLGGLDIHFVEPKGNDQWSAPENIGAPMNSRDDDFSFILSDDGTTGYLSSDREGGSGRDDIYSFVKFAAPVKVYVYDEETKQPIEGAEVTTDGCSKKTLKTGKDGKTTTDVKFNSCCTFTAKFEGYEQNTNKGCVKEATSTEQVMVEIPLRKPLKFNLEGVVYDQSVSLPLEGVKVTLTSTCGKADSTFTVTTDASGRFAFPLEKDCCYKLRGEKDKYLAVSTPDTLCTKGLKVSTTLNAILNLQPIQAPPVAVAPTTTPATGTDKPVAVADVPKDKTVVYYDPASGLYMKNGAPFTGKNNGVTYKNGQSKDNFQPSPTQYPENAQAYLLHIYYDFDQSYIRDESVEELQKLLKLLKDNPNYIIELSSHTDARGSNSYNNRLSQRRAESVVRWLIEKGVERDRLVPRGYGETMNTNRCANSIPCSEKEHQMNRRTEFRVLGCKGCTDAANTILSKTNDKAKVDNCKGCPF
jgi:outer membrane protein OmpA-like peptidoglycan-associated protein/Tol biopolymer transport system component